MNATDWSACKHPREMLGKLRRVSDRKLRLFAVACCRRIWHLFPHPSFQEAVVAVERFADGQTDWGTVVSIRELAKQSAKDQRRAEKTGARKWNSAEHKTYHAVLVVNDKSARYAAKTTSGEVVIAASFAASLAEPSVWPDWHERSDAARIAENLAHCELVRDIFGDRIRPSSFDPDWCRHTIAQFADTIYEERAFDRLPILADALEEVGCTDAAILDHLRGPGPHVRGCWVVDLLLGKT